MNANVPMLNEIAGKNTKEVIDALNETIRQQQAEIELLKRNMNTATNELLQQQAEIEALKEFAIWMTGCGYDFCKHDYFIKCRNELLVGKAQEK